MIRYGIQQLRGLVVEPLMGSGHSPVLSPDLLDGPMLRQPTNLTRFPLMRDEIDDEWDAWLACAGCLGGDWRNGPRVSHCELSLQAAERGQGMALGNVALIELGSAEGRLLQSFAIETVAHVVYAMAFPEGQTKRRSAAAFHSCLLDHVDRPAVPVRASTAPA